MVARGTGSLPVARRIERAVRGAVGRRRVVLAVSGGRDSMALLHAAVRVARPSVACVATYDHGTGSVATRAAELAASAAASLGVPAVVGRASRAGRNEAEWREQRRAFLRDVARRMDAAVVTAHTRDDQIETVLIRVLRGAGARGLAGLYAPDPCFVRPLLDVSRDDLARYAEWVGARWIDDPTNVLPRFLRNRVRRHVLPALAAASQNIGDDLLRIARAAAAWRAGVDAIAARVSEHRLEAGKDVVTLAGASLAGLDDAALRMLWPAAAARAGLAMDRRGTERAAEFTRMARTGRRMPLSGGWEIVRSRDEFELRRRVRLQTGAVPLVGQVARFGDWRFVAVRRASGPSDSWVARLPSNVSLTVRTWRAGDRMRAGGRWGTGENGERDFSRKVKRFLSDARVPAALRSRWPVVLAGDEIVWIPGVRRSDAASVRPGRPAFLYRCELDDS